MKKSSIAKDIRYIGRSVHHKELCDFLNEWDDVSTKAIIHFLDQHKFLYLKDRVKYEYSADFGMIRPLREVWIKLLDVNSFEFVDFYEDIYRFRKVPRYEDLFATVLISIACNLASNELYDRYKIWREKNKANKKLHDKFSKSAEVLFEYLIKIYALREAHLFGEIPYEKFEKIRNYLKRKILREDSKEDTNIENDFMEVWYKFEIRHLLFTPLAQEIDELRGMVKLEIENPSIVNCYTENTHPPADSIVLHATPASSGVVCGTVKIIDSMDGNKIVKGDIAVFKYFTPDMVHAIKRCVGTIGFPECGGLTGHLAIVSRELKIPCVVRCDYDKFSDGQVVYLDGNKGEVRIMLSIEDIEKYKITFDNYMYLKFFLEDLFKYKVDLVIDESIKPNLKPYILGSVKYAGEYELSLNRVSAFICVHLRLIISSPQRTQRTQSKAVTLFANFAPSAVKFLHYTCHRAPVTEA